MIDERKLIAHIKTLVPLQSRGLTLGIGDDCAIYTPRADEALVFTTDFTIEGIHFLRETYRAAEVGHKALARSLSDLAAMGAAPRFCLVSLALPPDATLRWVTGFYRGLGKLAAGYGMAVAGGDLSSHDRVTIEVMACGSVPRGQAMRRDAAKVGDLVLVTGPLGQSALGLARQRGAAWKRHKAPVARVSEGQALRKLGVRCAMDLSDGLSLDAARLAEASGVGIELDDVPVATGATEEMALHGGEDYELLFTARPKLRTGGIAIGRVVRGSGVWWRGRGLEAQGWDHFAKNKSRMGGRK